MPFPSVPLCVFFSFLTGYPSLDLLISHGDSYLTDVKTLLFQIRSHSKIPGVRT